MVKNAETASNELTTFQQAIKDPITRLLMERDGVTESHLQELADGVRARKAASTSRGR